MGRRRSVLMDAPPPQPATTPEPQAAPVAAVPDAPAAELPEVARVDAALAGLRHVTVDEDAAQVLRMEAAARDALRVAEASAAALDAAAGRAVTAFTQRPSPATFEEALTARQRVDVAPVLLDTARVRASAAAAALNSNGPARACASATVQRVERELTMIVGAVPAPAAVALDKVGQLTRTTSADLKALTAWEEWSRKAQEATTAAAGQRQASPLAALVACDRLIGETIPALRMHGEAMGDLARRADRSRKAASLPTIPEGVVNVDTRAAVRPPEDLTDPADRARRPPVRPGMTAAVPASPFAADMPFR